MSILVLMVLAALKGPADYDGVVQRVSEMTYDSELSRVCERYGLNVVNVTWEDTGRYAGSCWGPNISDLTIQVQHGTPRERVCTAMPVIRYPNFHDISADLDPENFYLLVGNEQGDEELTPVSLSDYVWGLRDYLHDPSDWPGRRQGLWAPRDSVVLVSAQAVFLPIPEDGEATFNPVLYNYQSYEGDPAVLAIVATREGTSAAIIDNSSELRARGVVGVGPAALLQLGRPAGELHGHQAQRLRGGWRLGRRPVGCRCGRGGAEHGPSYPDPPAPEGEKGHLVRWWIRRGVQCFRDGGRHGEEHCRSCRCWSR